jgi:hypothetical protein
MATTRFVRVMVMLLLLLQKMMKGRAQVEKAREQGHEQ